MEAEQECDAEKAAALMSELIVTAGMSIADFMRQQNERDEDIPDLGPLSLYYAPR